MLFISIHAPRTGSDTPCRRRSPSSGKFQSTLPARGATAKGGFPVPYFAHFNPRSPHGERLSVSSSRLWQALHFNPRSPHGERRYQLLINHQHLQFQSTLPARGATKGVAGSEYEYIFQSTLPARGATRFSMSGCARYVRFQSTLPARGATPRMKTCRLDEVISIHAPRTGSDVRHV